MTGLVKDTLLGCMEKVSCRIEPGMEKVSCRIEPGIGQVDPNGHTEFSN